MTGIFRVPNPTIARGWAKSGHRPGTPRQGRNSGQCRPWQRPRTAGEDDVHHGQHLLRPRPLSQNPIVARAGVADSAAGAGPAPSRYPSFGELSGRCASGSGPPRPKRKSWRATPSKQTARCFGSTDADTLVASFRLATILRMDGHTAESEKLYRELLPNEQRVFGPEDSRTLRTMGNLAGALVDEGRLPEAEKLARDTLAIQRRVLRTRSSQYPAFHGPALDHCSQ